MRKCSQNSHLIGANAQNIKNRYTPITTKKLKIDVSLNITYPHSTNMQMLSGTYYSRNAHLTHTNWRSERQESGMDFYGTIKISMTLMIYS